jgi:hypothetical protein
MAYNNSPGMEQQLASIQQPHRKKIIRNSATEIFGTVKNTNHSNTCGNVRKYYSQPSY